MSETETKVEETKVEETKAPETTSEEELKPLTDEEMESMSTEEITAHAEKLEAQVKESKKQSPDQIRANQIARAKKAQEKAFSSTTDEPSTPAAESKSNDIAQADVLTLAKQDFDLGSPEQKLLQQRVDQGVIASYAEGLTHTGVKAELEAIKAESDATTVIDENADTETQLRTTKEAVAQARANDEVPEDPKVREAMVNENIGNMSALK